MSGAGVGSTRPDDHPEGDRSDLRFGGREQSSRTRSFHLRLFYPNISHKLLMPDYNSNDSIQWDAFGMHIYIP